MHGTKAIKGLSFCPYGPEHHRYGLVLLPIVGDRAAAKKGVQAVGYLLRGDTSPSGPGLINVNENLGDPVFPVTVNAVCSRDIAKSPFHLLTELVYLVVIRP